MNRVKALSRISSILFFLLFWLSAAPFAYAQQTQCPSAFAALCKIDFAKGAGVGAIIQIIIILAAVAALGFLVWGGVKWITSGGDRGKIEQARGTIIAAIVGLIIALAAFFIVIVVLQIFTGQGLGSLGFPKLVPK